MKLRSFLVVLIASVLLPGCCWLHHHHHCCKPTSDAPSVSPPVILQENTR